MNRTQFTSEHGKKIVAGLTADYSNHPVMFDAESSVILSLDGFRLGKDARQGCRGDSLDFVMDIGGKTVAVEHKTTTADLRVVDDTENLFTKIKSDGVQISECGWASTGREALGSLQSDHWAVCRRTKSDSDNAEFLVTIQHETDTTRFVQVYSLNYGQIIDYCTDSKKVMWLNYGTKLWDRNTGTYIMTFARNNRTVLKMTREGLMLFNPKFLASGKMERRQMKYWTANVNS
jgi:hypothetical protein